MNSSNMKNMIVLKNLPSNIVEEAIIVLKENQKIKKPKYIPKEAKEENKKDDKYIIKEAEMIISEYISNAVQKNKVKTNKFEKKCKKLSLIASILGILCWIELILILV